MAKLTSRATMPNPTTVNDLVHIVDVSDTSQSPSGSSYKYPMSQLVAFLRKAGIGNWQSAAPTVNDDTTQGYINGAFWFDENAQKFYILNDNSAGAADWVAAAGSNLQQAYDAGNVVNGNTLTLEDFPDANVGLGIDALNGNTGVEVVSIGRLSGENNTGNFVVSIGNSAAYANTGDSVVSIGQGAAASNTGSNVNALGNAAALNTGSAVNAFGEFSAYQNIGDHVNAIGDGAGRENTADNSNFFGQSAGYDTGVGNTTAFGVTVFQPDSVPSYADHAAALAGLTVANGCVGGQVYIYRNVATNAIGFVLPV